MKHMAGRRRHSAEDIVRKLRCADDLAAQGKTGEQVAAELSQLSEIGCRSAGTFFKVTGLVDPPARLFHPSFIYRVATVNRRRRQRDSQPQQAEVAGRAESRTPLPDTLSE
jgi:hypothetical protein